MVSKLDDRLLVSGKVPPAGTTEPRLDADRVRELALPEAVG